MKIPRIIFVTSTLEVGGWTRRQYLHPKFSAVHGKRRCREESKHWSLLLTLLSRQRRRGCVMSPIPRPDSKEAGGEGLLLRGRGGEAGGGEGDFGADQVAGDSAGVDGSLDLP